VREGFHDPFVGTLETAAQRGFAATGADLVDRCGGRFAVRDFFSDTGCYSNLVTSPALIQAAEPIEYGLDRLHQAARTAIRIADLNFPQCVTPVCAAHRPEFELLLVLMKVAELSVGRSVSRRPGQAGQR